MSTPLCISSQHLVAKQILDKQQREHAFFLGSLELEYQERKKFFMEKIVEYRGYQKSVGEEALKALGLDVAAAEYSIREDGVVLKLQDGQWVTMEEQNGL